MAVELSTPPSHLAQDPDAEARTLWSLYEDGQVQDGGEEVTKRGAQDSLVAEEVREAGWKGAGCQTGVPIAGARGQAVCAAWGLVLSMKTGTAASLLCLPRPPQAHVNAPK